MNRSTITCITPKNIQGERNFILPCWYWEEKKKKKTGNPSAPCHSTGRLSAFGSPAEFSSHWEVATWPHVMELTIPSNADVMYPFPSRYSWRSPGVGISHTWRMIRSAFQYTSPRPSLVPGLATPPLHTMKYLFNGVSGHWGVVDRAWICNREFGLEPHSITWKLWGLGQQETSLNLFSSLNQGMMSAL